jgi:hypothetical protein
LEICDIILRLLAVSVVHSLLIEEWSCRDGTLITAPALACLMEHCQSLKSLTLKDLILDENDCRVLGDYSRPGLEIVLDRCAITTITDAGAGTLKKVLKRNQGPTKLDNCQIDNSVLANGLRGNSRLQSLRPGFSGTPDDSNREVFEIACALKENRGLVDLDLSYGSNMTDKTWDAVCDSLKAHPTLEVLDLRPREVPLLLKSRIQALVDMMKVNMSIHTIKLNYQHYGHTLFRGPVIPYLETNRLQPRLLAIQKTRPHAYRAKLLGRALLVVRADPNSFWMLLSGNPEVAFPSTTATTTAAASLPAPATAAATPSASTTAASSVAASATGLKRRACP